MGKTIWSLFKCFFFKCTQPLLDVLQNLNQHQLSVFLRTVYSIQTKATFLIYRMEWFSLLGSRNGMGHIWPPVQKSTKMWKRWKGNTALTIYASFMQCKFVTVLSTTSNIFGETEVKILGLGCERKHDLIHQHNVNKKAHEFVLYMSKQSITFKNAETSWLKGLFLAFPYQKCPSTYDFCHC